MRDQAQNSVHNSSITNYALDKDNFITGRANPISCAVGLR